MKSYKRRKLEITKSKGREDIFIKQNSGSLHLPRPFHHKEGRYYKVL